MCGMHQDCVRPREAGSRREDLPQAMLQMQPLQDASQTPELRTSRICSLLQESLPERSRGQEFPGGLLRRKAATILVHKSVDIDFARNFALIIPS